MEKIALSSTNPDACLECWCEKTDSPRPAVLIYPGGGYYFHGDAEQAPIADYYRSQGFQPFILMYSIAAKAHFPDPLVEGSKAVWEIRKNAAKYGVNPDQIALVGFSAGAHAAIMLANLWQDERSRQGTDIPEGGNRPNATVTGYTPTTFDDFYTKFPDSQLLEIGDPGSGPKNLLGTPDSGFDTLASLTVIPMISELTPPAFLWKTTADFPESSLEYALACKQHGVPYELHIFNDEKRCAAMEFNPDLAVNYDPDFAHNTQLWPEMSVHFLNKIFL